MAETSYASCGDLSLAYQVFGDGPVELVFAAPFVSHVELYWASRCAWPSPQFRQFAVLVVSYDGYESCLVCHDERTIHLMGSYLLVHGGWGAGWVWDDLAERLEKAGHEVRVVDPRGNEQAASPKIK